MKVSGMTSGYCAGSLRSLPHNAFSPQGGLQRDWVGFASLPSLAGAPACGRLSGFLPPFVAVSPYGDPLRGSAPSVALKRSFWDLKNPLSRLRLAPGRCPHSTTLPKSRAEARSEMGNFASGPPTSVPLDRGRQATPKTPLLAGARKGGVSAPLLALGPAYAGLASSAATQPPSSKPARSVLLALASRVVIRCAYSSRQPNINRR